METKKLLFYVLAGLLAGCVPVMSLYPLYTEQDVVFEEKLVGTWMDDSDSTWEFSAPNEPPKSYELVYTDDEGRKGSFGVYLTKIDDKLFLDAQPNKLVTGSLDEPNQVEWFYNAFFFLPLHTFIRVDAVEPALKMRLTDDEDMEKLLKEDPNAVKYEKLDDSIVLIASTKQLQAFVLKYADNDKFFTEDVLLRRGKAKEPNEPAAREPNAPADK